MTKKENDDDLIGFKDFIEYTDKKKGHKRRVENDNFELQTFLEKDAKRLSNQIELFEEKAYMLKTFSQSQKIKEKVIAENAELRDKIIQKLIANPSGLVSNLTEVLRSHFNS
ncbi:MAG: hypothetical protein CME62_09710 [Halobacteriovoraceae bacterium]|nr:hypothetical protein [Halobacteriovoraceae bacterium]|tara:strand:+ start:19160 stop:19495 length:336 start_codon:yes stop_codon:yes gene_type:complete